MSLWTRRFLYLVVAVAVTLPAGSARGQDDASRAGALIRDLKDPAFERANTAAQELGKYPQYRAQIIPALIEAIKTGDWERCGGDARDAIARTLMTLKAKEAVGPLLDLLKSGKPIDHECVE